MAFVDLVESLAGCVAVVAGGPVTGLTVEAGQYEGELSSTQELRVELTESLWLDARRIRVSLNTADWKDASLSLILEPRQGPVLFVVYHGGAPLARETLRAVVERRLPPDPPNPRRRLRWAGPILGFAFGGTVLLIVSRTPSIRAVHLRTSGIVRDALLVLNFFCWIVPGVSSMWLAFTLWFPPLERLPDSAKSRWDRRRGWVQLAIGLWVTIVIGVLALPVRH